MGGIIGGRDVFSSASRSLFYVYIEFKVFTSVSFVI